MSKQPLEEQLDQAIDRMLANPDAIPLPVDPEVVALLDIARELRDLPRPDFKANLRTDLERKAIMVRTKLVHTITPCLYAQDLDYVDFLKRVFDAREVFRGEVSAAVTHVELRIGDSTLMVAVGSGRKMPATIELYVSNADEIFKRAIESGCVELQPVRDAHWEPVRFGSVQDRAGNGWVIATHLGKTYVPEGRNSISASFVLEGAARFAEFLKQAFAAHEIQRWEWPGGFFASLRIGDSVVGVCESTNHEWMRPMRTSVHMHVPNCETQLEAALRAGAKSISPVADQPYGVRGGTVEDAWGNQWFIGTPL